MVSLGSQVFRGWVFTEERDTYKIQESSIFASCYYIFARTIARAEGIVQYVYSYDHLAKILR